MTRPGGMPALASDGERRAPVCSALAGGAARRPRLVIALALALGAGGGGARAAPAPDRGHRARFVSSSSSQYRATQSYYRSFGEEPIEVLVKGDLQQLVLSSDIERLLGLEGCLSGNVPASALRGRGRRERPLRPARARAHGEGRVRARARSSTSRPARSTTSSPSRPRRAAPRRSQADRWSYARALARGLPAAQARTPRPSRRARLTLARFQESLATLALRYGLTAPAEHRRTELRLDARVRPTQAGRHAQAALRLPVPEPQLGARLGAPARRALRGRSARTRSRLIRRAVAMSQWRLQHGESYLVTGEPVIVSDLTELDHALARAAAGRRSLLVMAATLALVFRGRPRLLPLALALLAARAHLRRAGARRARR